MPKRQRPNDRKFTTFLTQAHKRTQKSTKRVDMRARTLYAQLVQLKPYNVTEC
jgi:hypothetical protein